MFVWCSYCQHFQGEKAPFQQLSVTHTICTNCYQSEVFLDSSAVEKLQPMVEFSTRLFSAAIEGRNQLISSFLEEGLALGFNTSDLLVGIVQPSLQQIGELWAQNKITVAQEHAFSSFCSVLILQMKEKFRPNKFMDKLGQTPKIMLSNIKGNEHTLGIVITNLLLQEKSIPCVVQLEPLSAGELVSLSLADGVKLLALSISLSSQLAEVTLLAKLFLELPLASRPQIVLSGSYWRLDEKPIEDWEGIPVCRSLQNFEVFLSDSGFYR